MTPAQMLRSTKSPPQTQRLLAATGSEAARLVYQSQSDALLAGVCPVCHHPVETELDKTDQMVVFKCISNPVFHEWRRTQGFLVRD